MFFRLLFHLVFVSVFLIGSTFSCMASTDEVVEHGHDIESTHMEVSDDCCPEDGHQKQIEGKNIIQILQRQNLDAEPFVPQTEEIFYHVEARNRDITSYYRSPPYDRHQLFFTDTIRLIV